jgi:hypothetical protein
MVAGVFPWLSSKGQAIVRLNRDILWFHELTWGMGKSAGSAGFQIRRSAGLFMV